MFFISLSTVLLHVVLGLPLLLFLSGVQCSAVLVIDCGALHSTCAARGSVKGRERGAALSLLSHFSGVRVRVKGWG